MRNLFKINHFTSIFKNWTFWFWLLTPLVVGLYIGRLIWIELDISMTLKGYQSFLEFSKLPFSVMGLTFPCVGIYIFQYKSKQSSEIILIDKIQQEHARKDKYLDSFIALSIVISRLKNYTGYLDHNLKKTTFNFEKLHAEFINIYKIWNNIFEDSKYNLALAHLYNDFDKVEPLFKGVDLKFSHYEYENLKLGVFLKIQAELDVIHLKIFKESSHCECASIQYIMNERTLHGLDVSEEKVKLKKEYEVMEGHISELKILEKE